MGHDCPAITSSSNTAETATMGDPEFDALLVIEEGDNFIVTKKNQF